MSRQENRLASESSLYLLQHAHNPVDWFPWGEEAFAKARIENKLVLVSIGYSSCHWCHVMERETFEDEAAAEVMNRFFVCIKVDREERPDIDQIYMNAVQLMSGQGGWPLNCILLPDARPIYGGTYFPNEKWKEILSKLHVIWIQEPEKVVEYANRLTEGIQLSDALIANEEQEFDASLLIRTVNRLKTRWDKNEGGPNHAPKFPLPINYLFLLHYGANYNDAETLQQVKLTLDKMAMGGLFDQLAGGFYRYSTDMVWKIPHFEKMLYDNAQLMALYSEAYRYFKSDLYKETVYKIAAFLKSNWEERGAYFSSSDADSEGEEGKYYVWTKKELEQICGEDYAWVKNYYDIEGMAYWEDGKYVLLRRENDNDFAKQQHVSLEELKHNINRVNTKLLKYRSNRIAPQIDKKVICSWNAMQITAWCEAYKSFADQEFLQSAKASGHFILSNLLKSDGGLFHVYQNEVAKIDGFLEDYAFCIQAFIHLFEVSGEELWLEYANKWSDYCQNYFYDHSSQLYFFTSSKQESLIARKVDYLDNVIPGSNSVLCKSFFLLSRLNGSADLEQRAKRMLQTVYSQIEEYGASFANWADCLHYYTRDFNELIIAKADAEIEFLQLYKSYFTNTFVVMLKQESELELLKNRFKSGEQRYYLCTNKSCSLPLYSFEELKSKWNG